MVLTGRQLENFITKIEYHFGGCWIWTAGKDKDGYGQFNVGPKNVKAHRLAYELFVGSIPEGFEPDHLCRVRNCVNPDDQ